MHRSVVDVEKLLREREARGLYVPAALRIVVTLYLAASIVLWGPTDLTTRMAVVPGGAVLVGINILFLWLLSQRLRVRLLGYLGASCDALALAVAAWTWYHLAALGELAPGFLSKAPLTIYTLALIAINSLALRPAYPAIVALGGVATQLVIGYATVTDARTVWATDFAAIFSTSAVTPILLVNQITITAIVGACLSYLSWMAERTIRQGIELEAENSRIQQEQLRLLMEQKLAALAKLVAGISHEMNNPLGALRAGVDTLGRAAAHAAKALRRGDARGAERPLAALLESASLTDDAAKRLDAILLNLRRFARLDQATRQRIDPRECIDSALSMLSPAQRDAITVDVPKALPIVECDPSQLNQALLAVLSHATARNEDGVTLTTSSGDAAVIVVAVGYRCELAEGEELFDVTLASHERRVEADFDLPIASSILVHHGGSLELQADGARRQLIARVPAVGE